MKISTCSTRPVLVSCSLENFDLQVDPYVGCSHYCRYCYVLDQAETDWTEEIRIHADLAGQLGTELEGHRPQTIYMGYHSDSYQPCESELQQTRKALELFLERGFSVSLLTKSDLVLRDKDLLQQMDGSNVSVSVAFNDDQARQLFEANTIQTRRRTDALKELRDAGIGTSAMICPVIPRITDVLPLVEAVAPYTSVIWVYGLSVQEPSQRCWRNVQDILGRHFQDLDCEIQSIVMDRNHPYWASLRQELQGVKEKGGLDIRVHV